MKELKDEAFFEELADLLQPSLTENDDAVGFDRPWNPRYIVLLSFFFGAITGGWLFAFNARRLGLKRQFWPFLLAAPLFSVALLLTTIYGSLYFLSDWDRDTRADAVRVFRNAVIIFVGWLVSGSQRQRFRLATMTDAPKGNLWVAGAVAGVVGLAVDQALIELVILLFIGK